MAVVTLRPDSIRGGVPAFIANNEQEQMELAGELGRIMRGDVFRLKNGTIILLPIEER